MGPKDSSLFRFPAHFSFSHFFSAFPALRHKYNPLFYKHTGTLKQMVFIIPGCNEVHSLGQSETTKFLMKKEGLTREDLYLRWVKKTAKHVSRKHSGHVIPIIWDDMLRDMSVKVLQVGLSCRLGMNEGRNE